MGTTYLQDTRIRVDGLGRVLNRWETNGGPDIDNTYYRSFERQRNTYADNAPASVTTLSAIDYDSSTFAVRFSESHIDLDGHGRTIRQTLLANGTAPADHITSYTYDKSGLLTSVDAPDPSQNNDAVVTYTYAYDSLGKMISTRRPDSSDSHGRSGVDVSYDAMTVTTTEVLGAAGGKPSTTVTTKDSFGRQQFTSELTEESNFSKTTYSYDANDNVIRIVDPTNAVTSMNHDFASRRTSISRANVTWNYTYDKNGNEISETSPGSTAPIQPDVNYMTVTTYDDMDFPIGTSVGQRSLSAADAEAVGTSFHRYFYELGASSVGQLADTETYAPSGKISTTTQFLYDLQGRREYTYETYSGLPSQYRNTLVSFAIGGQPSSTSYFDWPGAIRATHSTINYDNRGLPQSIDLSTSPDSSNVRIAVQTRNVAGHVTKRRTEVVNSPMAFVESNWTFDTLGRVTSQIVQKGSVPTQVARQDLSYYGSDAPKAADYWLGASNHKHFGYEFDSRNQLVGVHETQLPNAFSAVYKYNSAGRFLSASETSAKLDGADVQPRDVDYRYEGADPEQVTNLIDSNTGRTTWAYLYDTSGNQIMRCNAAIVTATCLGSDRTEYLYDGEDRLRRATRTIGDVVQGIEDYWYDGSGNRNIVVKKDASGTKTETVWFIGDTEAHYDGDDKWVHSYAHISIGTPVARVDTDTTLKSKIEYQFHGLANNLLAAVDSLTGTINASFDFAPFGELIEATNAGGTTSGSQGHLRRMNDKLVDTISGLSYYGYRLYDKTSMTWTQQDPKYRFGKDLAMGRPRRGNLYAFSLNNPLSYMDPDGLDSFGASSFFGHNVSGSVAAAGAAIEAPSTGTGECFYTARREYRQLWALQNQESGGALGIAAWRADKRWGMRAIMAAGGAFSPRGDLDQNFRGVFWARSYQLDSRAMSILAPTFQDSFGFDVGNVNIRFGYTGGADAYSVGNYITLDEDHWNRISSTRRIALLAHELTHCVQYDRISQSRPFYESSKIQFLIRYNEEYGLANNYKPSDELLHIPLKALNVIDFAFTLDQIAERVSIQFLNTLPPNMDAH